MINPDPKGHYARLGVDPTATANEITKQYRRLMMRHHPDRPGGNEEIAKEIKESYEILSDPERRQLYDESGLDGVDRDVMNKAIFQLKDFFSSYLDKGGDEDPLVVIRKCLNDGMTMKRQQVINIELMIVKLERRRGVVKKRKQGNDLFEAIRREKIASLKQQVYALQRSIQVGECCLQLADTYECPIAEPTREHAHEVFRMDWSDLMRPNKQ